MSRSRGHLRLVEPLPPEPPEDSEQVLASTAWSELANPVDTTRRLILFKCPTCGKQSSTDRPVKERWCTGQSGPGGLRAHMPVQMSWTEVE